MTSVVSFLIQNSTCLIILFLAKAHSSVERAAQIAGVMIRKVPTDDTYAVRGEMLKKMVEMDKAAGLIPFYVREYKKKSVPQGCTLARNNNKKPNVIIYARDGHTRWQATWPGLKDNIVSVGPNLCLSG